ncbi:hypothetical protein IIB34_06105 [PVC group bacterium]|nr:hypothetical protein [PVC group bacterium]
MSKRTQIDLGRTANTRIVIDTTPDRITKQYVKENYQKLPTKLKRVTSGRYTEDQPPKGTSFEKKANNFTRIPDDPMIGLSHRFRHGYPHAVQITMDRRTYLQLQKFAHEEIRTPTGAVRQIIIDAVKRVVIDPKINIEHEEELLNAT